MYVGDDALNDVAPARAMGMVSVWYKQEDAELEPLTEEVDYTITTIENCLKFYQIILKQKEKNNMAMDLITKQDGTTLHYSTMGQGYPVVLVHTAFDNYAVLMI